MCNRGSLIPTHHHYLTLNPPLHIDSWDRHLSSLQPTYTEESDKRCKSTKLAMTTLTPAPPSPSKPGSSPPNSSIPIAPPPWKLKAKAWTFFYSNADSDSTPSSQNPNNIPEILNNVLPPGAYHPLETIHPEALEKLPNGRPQYRDEWIKGVMVIRYEDSNVGPYDELILVPSQAVNPHTGKADKRISNIYVSTDASVWNGRRNWSMYNRASISTSES